MRQHIPNVETEDLGHQLISGLDVVGLRMWHTPASASGTESKPASSYNDIWCSDDLGAVVQQTFATGSPAGTHKHEILMQDIERREPDPSLFQIPSDYTIIERATDGNRGLLPRLIPVPSDSSKPQ